MSLVTVMKRTHLCEVTSVMLRIVPLKQAVFLTQGYCLHFVRSPYTHLIMTNLTQL